MAKFCGCFFLLQFLSFIALSWEYIYTSKVEEPITATVDNDRGVGPVITRNAQFSFSPFPKKRKRLSLCSFDQSLSCHFHVHCEVCCADSGLTSVNTRNGCSRPRNCGVILSYNWTDFPVVVHCCSYRIFNF